MNSINHLLRICGLALILATMAPSSQAQATSEPLLVERSFDKESLERYRSDPQYRYERDKPEPPQRKPKPRSERRVHESRPVHYNGPRFAMNGLAQGIIWVLIIGAVIFVLAQLLKVNWAGLRKKKSDKAKVAGVGDIPVEEDVTKMEFEDLLQTAIDAGKFRVAVRLLYLRTLRQLSDERLITWRKEKTNHEYLRELKDRNLRPGFSDVTLIFEYIWYGEIPVNKDDFNLARASFIQFEQTLRQHHAV
jgi:Domain of unknown function (DUF4129)